MYLILIAVVLFVAILLGVQFLRRRRIRRMTSSRHDYYRR